MAKSDPLRVTKDCSIAPCGIESRGIESRGVDSFSHLSGVSMTRLGVAEAFRQSLLDRIAAESGDSIERVGAYLDAAGAAGNGLIALGESAHRLGRCAVHLGAALAGSLVDGHHPHDFGVRSSVARSVDSGSPSAGEVEIDVVPIALGLLYDRRVLTPSRRSGPALPSAELDALIDLPFISRVDGSLASPAQFFRLDDGVRSIDPALYAGALSQVVIEPYRIARAALAFAEELRLSGSRYVASAIERRLPLEAVRLIVEKDYFGRGDVSVEGSIALHLLDTLVGTARTARDECIRAHSSM